MIAYLAAATALKFFSISPITKRAYRELGNAIGQRARLKRGLATWRLGSAAEILEIIERRRVIEAGDKLLEIGTGWVHWEATIIRLFYDVEITLFDIWDNRQLEAYKRFFSLFEEVMDKELGLDSVRSGRAHKLLQIIARANSFDDIYSALGFRYVIDPNGSLRQFEDESFSAIISCAVFEHIQRALLPEVIKNIHRLLQPGGYSIHGIDLGDHLSYYDPSASYKNYLRYSDNVWRYFFQNDVQYFNRVQRPEWLELFSKAGFDLVDEIAASTDIGSMKIATNYENLERSDLQCSGLKLIHKRPDSST
jgi:cyclopropane fatty-acyl-phospholipid synthase-like methyltransferase